MIDANGCWTVYLAGEIHTDWRTEIAAHCRAVELPFRFTAPVTDHKASDDCGVAVTGPEATRFWHDHKGAGLNAVRTRTLIATADIVVVRFGDMYRQWNAAFEAGIAHALAKPVLTLHPEAHDHALKEIDAAAALVCRTPEQVAQALVYVVSGKLPRD